MSTVQAAELEQSGQGLALQQVHIVVESLIRQLLHAPDEAQLDSGWSRAAAKVAEFSLRPAKRIRPALLIGGHALATSGPTPAGVWQFASALELLHTFMLAHDDVADAADTRRGGPALHKLLSSEKKRGEDLAIVAGDHLFARALELMLTSDTPRAAQATRYMLEVCRHTAAGQYLDLELSSAPLCDVTIFQTLKVANLKTARYGFTAPLVVGAMLGDASPELLSTLEQVGRRVGLAFQLRDDLISLFGDGHVSGKPNDCDFFEGRRTFPVIAAWTRAPALERLLLEELWALPREKKGMAEFLTARDLVEGNGGVSATLRVIDRCSRGAIRALSAFPLDDASLPMRAELLSLIQRLSSRAS